MGNADHADIVHCRMRTELIVRLARGSLTSPSQDRFATATDDPHTSDVVDDARINACINARVIGDKKTSRRELAPVHEIHGLDRGTSPARRQGS
jgi:hypothetical protein